jgi:ABC-type transport system substrate-binding protein
MRALGKHKKGTKSRRIQSECFFVVSLFLFPISLFSGSEGNKKDFRRVVVCDDNQDPGDIDPFFTFTEKKFTLLQQMLEGLVRFDSEAKIIPALAESWVQVDPLAYAVPPEVRKSISTMGKSFDADMRSV